MHQFVIRDKTGFTVLTVYSHTSIVMLQQIIAAYPYEDGYRIFHRFDHSIPEMKMAA